MGCGCGGLPPSVTLRIEAARIAMGAAGQNMAPERFTTMAEAVHGFLIAGTSEKELDDKAAKKPADNGVADRNAFVNGPLAAMLMLREPTIDKLETAGIMHPGSLVQWTLDQVREHAQLTAREVEILQAELAGRGLIFGMTGDQVRTWIKGKNDAAETQGH